MKKVLLAALFTWAGFAPQACRADLVFSLTSPDNLSQFAVGDTATFVVSIAGTAADAPGYLSASIQIDPSILSIGSVTPGVIVPDTSGFDSSASVGGTVSAYYDDSIYGTAPITSDGIFYSFTLTRTDASATVISFSGYSAQDDLGNNISITASPDSITIPGIAASVPEPSSLFLAIVGLAPVAYLARNRTIRPAAIRS